MAPRGDIAVALPLGGRHQAFSLEPAILHGFLTADECAALQAYATEHMMARARLAGGMSEHAVRSAGALWLDDDELPWLSRKLVRALADLNRDYFPFDLDGFNEGFQLLQYDGAAETGTRGDFYDWHIDIGGSGTTMSRKLSLVVQLSDPADYEGGRLEINAGGDVKAMPISQGTLIAFPSFVLHHVSPVTAGRRFSLAAWVHGPAFR